MLSIIVPCLDPYGEQSEQLSCTIHSVEWLLNCQHELIVVSPAKLQPEEARSETGVRFVAETHPSHPQALNDGIRSAKGSHILVLNPGDILLPSARVGNWHASLDTRTLYAFPVIGENSNYVGSHLEYLFDSTIAEACSRHGDDWFLNLPHQGLVIPADLHRTYALFYNQVLRIRMDYDLLARIACCCLDYRLVYSTNPVSFYPDGGKSMQIRNRPRFYLEAGMVELQHQWYIRSLSSCSKAVLWKIFLSAGSQWKS